MALVKSFSTPVLLASAIAGIVGSGWLLGPLASVKIAGPAAIISWLIGGLLMLIVAGSFVLLARIKPITGGTVRFLQMTYGDFAGFSFSWIAWLAWIAVAPIETMAFIQYMSTYVPSLMTRGHSSVLTGIGFVCAACILLLISAVNNYGVKLYKKVNGLILAFKLFVPIATVVILVSTHCNTDNFIIRAGFMPFGWHSVFAALPLAGIVYSFIGFNPVIELAAESTNPNKSTPIAVFGALIVCVLLYVSIQAAFIAALPAESLSQGWGAVHYKGDHGPFIGLLLGFGFIYFIKCLYIDACISPVGTAMVQSLTTSRLTYAMSENGYLPKILLRTNNSGNPRYCIWLNFIIGVLFFLPFPSWQRMVGFLVSCLVLGYVAGPMSLLVVAMQESKRFNVVKKYCIHVLALLGFYICNLMIIWSGWHIVMKLIILFFTGYIVLAAMICLRNGSKRISSHEIMRGSWTIFYMLGLAIISSLTTFEGSGLIPFGVDFGILAIFSLLIYILAYCLMSLRISLNYIDRTCMQTI